MGLLCRGGGGVLICCVRMGVVRDFVRRKME